MKLVCHREKLLSAFQTAASVAPSRSPMPILQNVKLEVTKSGAELLATDTEVGIRISLPAGDDAAVTVERPGTVILPVARFGAILRENSDARLHIESKENLTLVRGERSEFKLPAENPDEFPAVATFSEAKFFELPAVLLKRLVQRTLFATDTETGRYALGGVLLEFGADKITAVGTDGRRLSKMEGPAVAHGGAAPSDAMTIVPARSMQLIDRAINEHDTEIQVCARANDILLKSPRATIYSRLVEGRFPRWRDVLPSGRGELSLQIPVGPMLQCVRQAAIVASEETKGIDLTFADGNVVMSGSTADVGEAKVDMPVSYNGKPITITLNHRFIADFLKVLDPQTNFTLDLNDGDSPAMFTTDDGFSYVVMPLNRAGK